MWRWAHHVGVAFVLVARSRCSRRCGPRRWHCRRRRRRAPRIHEETFDRPPDCADRDAPRAVSVEGSCCGCPDCRSGLGSSLASGLPCRRGQICSAHPACRSCWGRSRSCTAQDEGIHICLRGYTCRALRRRSRKTWDLRGRAARLGGYLDRQTCAQEADGRDALWTACRRRRGWAAWPGRTVHARAQSHA